jgi:hypothetical protein
MMMPGTLPTVEELRKARQVFIEHEPRDLFYKVATELIKLAIENKTEITLAEALAVLLQTWNKAYYQFRPFNAKHFSDISTLVTNHAKDAFEFRDRSILSLSEDDFPKIKECFRTFERVLGPVGASKSLHLLAPRFFPLWDRDIAVTYGVGLGPVGTNATDYCRFMTCAKEQCTRLKGQLPESENPLKSIDEYNYCHFTKGWL